jgi:hypothetical protein
VARIAQPVADQLGSFDLLLFSSDKANLSRAQELTGRWAVPDEGFDHVGISADDLPMFER